MKKYQPEVQSMKVMTMEIVLNEDKINTKKKWKESPLAEDRGMSVENLNDIDV